MNKVYQPSKKFMIEEICHKIINLSILIPEYDHSNTVALGVMRFAMSS